MSVPANNDSTQFGASRNAAVLSNYLPAIGTRVVIAADKSLPADADAVLVALIDGEDGLELVAPEAIGSVAEQLLASFEAVSASAKSESVTTIPAPAGLDVDSVTGVGVGSEDLDAEDIRRACGAAARRMSKAKVVFNTLGAIDPQAAAEGFALGAYAYSGQKSDEESNEATQKVVVLGADDDVVKRAAAIVDAVATARDFVNTASSHLYPETFADAAAALGRDAGIEVEVLDDDALRAGGFGGLNAVGGGSSRGPRLVRLIWKGDESAEKSLGLVGKGITFDTGGISLKPGASMENMISDMGGAAAVIATVVLAARLGVSTPVTATVPMAENMPGGKAYRPGDVITQYGGKTIEILNTDAEGRLVLADAIVRACEDKPTHLIDTATLTGAQLVALGERTPGILGNDEFRDRVAELSQSIGENGWAMPIPVELAEALKSPVADLRNVTNSRFGGMSVAAAYLREFVGEDVEWVHIDVAGPAFNTIGEYGYTPKRGTGVPVRTMFSVIEDLATK